MQKSSGDSKKIYYNKPQQNSWLVDANEEYSVMGRGTGKTTGILAPRAYRNIKRMPRSTGVLIGESYIQILTRTLPSFIDGLEKLGIIRDQHYFIGKRAPRTWKWELPYQAPSDFSHFIHFWNGTGIHLISQDRKGSSNGLNTDWIIGDEAKYLKYEQFLEETVPTMRANRDKFGHLACHKSICFTTSMPTLAEAKWILKKSAEVDQEQIDLIFYLNAALDKLQRDAQQANQKQLAKIRTEHKRLMAALEEVRKGSIYAQRASSLENVAVLGLDTIRKWKRIMPDFMFKTEILNEEPDTVEGGFYPLLDSEHHGYSHSYNNALLEEFHYDMERLKDQDSRFDADCISDLPLRGAADWGGKINCLSITQDLTHTSLNEIRFINSFYVKHPKILDHVAHDFVKYYRYHRRKVFYFVYDHTGNTELANSTETYAQQFAKILRAAGWTVIMVTKGAAPTHGEKYLLMHRVLGEQERLPRLRFNKYKCKELLTSMKMAPAYDTPKGIRKDKSSERSKMDQSEATHFSDTADMHVVSLCKYALDNMPSFLPNVYSSR